VSEPEAELLVSVADADALPAVVRRLEAAGMRVHRTLVLVGAVTGSAPVACVAEIERVEGVLAVERARRHELAPPDADVQ